MHPGKRVPSQALWHLPSGTEHKFSVFVWESGENVSASFLPFILLGCSEYALSPKKIPTPSSLHSQKTESQRKGNSCQS